ncbi:hypothetical protein EXIGLDRAFT_633970 [Exidia glandulosa HHB12029]|uniref:CxC2-like cysteine cluster KDZ transposase-associated domain-containing protein n=1 Tax=Exidia glandulosa HHB12029 TaxID=1314781 RepID=A0A165Z0Z8_EXIGL|nr:hypothetical protein EXIGLDRAFT_634018 [Exidia glandulosa HHB12029]KZV78449.1 hypothetical protein EXIGLDRAFT_633970 [Exidia glandulosa HHB12029]
MHEREHDSRIGGACMRCHVETRPALYKCFMCFQLPPLCEQCVKDAHKHAPFHDIQVWRNNCFSRITLASIGFVVNLGHDGDPCPHGAAKSTSKYTVLHEGGIHEVQALRCFCPVREEKGRDAMTLWRSDLFPATFLRPQTAMTSGVLRGFHLLTLTTKVTASGFCTYLRRRTSYWSKDDSKDRAREFFMAFRMFCFLLQLKRHAQSPPSLDGELRAGSLAIFCAACPQPGINMTPGWESRPREKQ